MDKVEYSEVFFISLAVDISCLSSLHFFVLENDGPKSSAGTPRAHTAVQLASVIDVVPVYISSLNKLLYFGNIKHNPSYSRD